MSDGGAPTIDRPTLSVRRPLADALGPHRRTIVVGLCWRGVEGVASLVPYLAVGWVAAQLVDDTLDTGAVVRASIVVTIGVAVSVAAAWAGNRRVFAPAYEVGRTLRRRLVRTVRRAPVGDVLIRPRGEVATTIDRDVADVEGFLNGALPGLASNIAASGAAVIAVALIDPLIGLGLALTTGVLAVAYRANLRARARHTAYRQQLRAAQDERIVEYVQGIEVARAYDMGSHMATRLDDALRGYRDANLASVRRTVPLGATIAASASIASGVLLAVAGARYGSGAIDAPTFAALVVVTVGAARALLAVGSGVGALPGVAGALARIAALGALAERPAVPSGDSPRGTDIACRDVHFAYERDPVLRGVTFDVLPGAMTAIVGRSGAGKSTIMHLLAGIWTPDSGRMFIGGVDVAELSDADRARWVSFVPQDPWLPDGTIREAIALGLCGGADEEQIVAAARRARCHDFIEALPDGYDTVVGEGGRRLSGGQRQRVAIARALVADTPIVCLDEATAALDASSERALHESLDALGERRTLLVVAHRPSTIRRADHIVVVDGGVVAETGTHDALVASGGLYAQRWASRITSSQDGVPS